MEWVASTLHTTSEHGVSSITTADAHTSVASSRLNWRPRRFKWTRPFRRKTKAGFCACAITFQLASTSPQHRPRRPCNSPRKYSSTLHHRVFCLPAGQQWNPEGCSGQCLGMGHNRTAVGSRLQGADVEVEARGDGMMPLPHHHRHQGRREDHPHVVTAYDYRRYGGGGA